MDLVERGNEELVCILLSVARELGGGVPGREQECCWAKCATLARVDLDCKVSAS